MTKAACLVLSSVALLGCSKGTPAVSDGAIDRSLAPDPRAAICPPSDAAVTVGYDQIQRIFDDNCVGCHDVGSGGDPALDLRPGMSWSNLVNQPAPAPDTCGGTLVVPGDPGDSYLYEKVSSSTPCYGVQMPKGEFFASDPLPACVIAMVNRWITEGAPGPVTDASGG